MKKFLGKYEITDEMLEQMTIGHQTVHHLMRMPKTIINAKLHSVLELLDVTGATLTELKEFLGPAYHALKQCPQPIPQHIQSEQNSYYYEVEKYISKGQHYETWTRISNALDHHGHPVYKKIPYADIPSYGLILHNNEKITKLEYEQITERRNSPLNITRRKKSK